MKSLKWLLARAITFGLELSGILFLCLLVLLMTPYFIVAWAYSVTED